MKGNNISTLSRYSVEKLGAQSTSQQHRILLVIATITLVLSGYWVFLPVWSRYLDDRAQYSAMQSSKESAQEFSSALERDSDRMPPQDWSLQISKELMTRYHTKELKISKNKVKQNSGADQGVWQLKIRIHFLDLLSWLMQVKHIKVKKLLIQRLNDIDELSNRVWLDVSMEVLFYS